MNQTGEPITKNLRGPSRQHSEIHFEIQEDSEAKNSSCCSNE